MLFPLCLTNLAFRVQVYRRRAGPFQAGTGVRGLPVTCWERRSLGMPFSVWDPEPSHSSQAAWGNPTTAHPHPFRNPDAGQVQQHEEHAGCWWGHHHEPAFASLYYNPAARAWAHRYSVSQSPISRSLINAWDGLLSSMNVQNRGRTEKCFHDLL